MIRAATPGDIPGIAEIWNPIIRTTGITFTARTKSTEDLATLIASRPVFVFGQDRVEGFATYGPFRGGDGYRHTAEHTILLSPDARGRGQGRALMAHLMDHARGAGIHTLWAGCSAENPGGIAFHERLGFTRTAHLPQVGRKFDRWIDLILLHRML